MRLLLLAVLLLGQRPSVPQAQTGTVTGRVLNGDGSPAVKIRVSAMSIPDSRNVANETPVLMTLTETDNLGRYRLVDVPIGRYYIVAGFVDSPTYYPRGTKSADATVINVTTGATIANIDFRAERLSTGITVSGRVIQEASLPQGASAQVTLSGGPSGQYLNTAVKLDGSFEFSRVAPGNYYLAVGPSPFPEQRNINVADKDIKGLELLIPWTAEVNGKVVVDGGGPAPTVNVSFVGGGRPANSYPGNQSFRTSLAEGFYGVAVMGTPSGFYVKSIMAGTADLLSQPLRISRKISTPEIVVTLGVSTPSPWVKVSGRVSSSSQSTARGVTRFTLYGPIGSLEVAVGADGSFEVPKILPGTYTLNLQSNTPTIVQAVSLVVPNRDLLGIELVLPAVKEVSGRVTVEDGGPPPRSMLSANSLPAASRDVSTTSLVPSLEQLFVTVTQPGRATQIPVNPLADGTFKVSLPEGQFQIAANVPSINGGSYSVKALSYGTTDLLKDPLIVSAADSAELRLTLASSSPGSWVKVSGRVLGLPSPQVPASVSLVNSTFVSSLTVAVRPDGTFEFPKVYSGSYRAQLSAPIPNTGLLMTDVNVKSSDVTGVEFVIPRQKQISGRVLLEGRGPLPQLSIPLTNTSPGAGAFSSAIFMTINPQPDGSFQVTLPQGERTVGRPSALPPGYTLKSLTYGAVDLMTSSMKVLLSDTAELRLTVSTPNLAPVKVSGKVMGIDATMRDRGPITLSITAPGYVGALQGVVSADGSFEFPEVFPGSYTARVTGPGIANFPGPSNAPVVVGNSDVRGVEITVSAQKEITGRISVEGSAPVPRFSFRSMLPVAGNVNGGATALGALSININPSPDGTFRVIVPEGERPLEPTGLPKGYAIKSAVYGSTDLLRNPLKVSRTDTAELLISLSAPTLNPVSVSGRVSGLGPQEAARAVLNSANFAVGLNTPIRSDGSFEFSAVFPGNYNAQVIALGLIAGIGTPNVPVVVADSPVKDIQLTIPARQTVSGRLVIQGGGPMVRLPLSFSTLPATGAVATLGTVTISPATDGTFRLALPRGDFRTTLTLLPPGYTLKSLTYGTTDVRQSPLRITADSNEELQITLEKTLAAVSVNVSGRVVGLTSEMQNVRVGLVGAYYVPLQTTVNPDGSFTFSQVVQGSYTAQLIGVLSGNSRPITATFTVGAKDVTGIELVIPH